LFPPLRYTEHAASLPTPQAVSAARPKNNHKHMI
jgi:hypothetical protein